MKVKEFLKQRQAEKNAVLATNFYNWLVKRAEDPADDPAGDFATDAAADSFFPRNIEANAAGFAAVFNYLYFNRRVHYRVIDAFIESWETFYKDATGENWTETNIKNNG